MANLSTSFANKQLLLDFETEVKNATTQLVAAREKMKRYETLVSNAQQKWKNGKWKSQS